MFDKYTGTIVLNVDGLELKVRPTNRQVAKFMSLDEKTIRTEEGFVALTSTLASIISDSYPEEDKENIANMVLNNVDTVMEELVTKMGWMSKAELKAKIDKGNPKVNGVKKPSA